MTAVTLNLTITDTPQSGWVQAFPTGHGTLGASSNLNVSYAGQTVANLVTVPVGNDGSISLFDVAGGDLIVDVEGYYAQAASSSAGRYHPLTPTRIVDSRTRLGLPAASPSNPDPVPAPGQTFQIQVAGAGGVPASGVSAVALSVTATQSSAAGWVQVIPTGGPTPLSATSNLNLTGPGQTVANLVIVPLGSGGSVQLYNSGGTHLIMDVTGYYTDDTAPVSSGGLFVPVDASRLTDTRPNSVAAGSQTPIAPLGRAGLPAHGVSAVLFNTTVTQTAASGWTQLIPTGHSTPGASSTVSWTGPGQTVATAAIAELGDSGQVTAYAAAGTQLILDVFGYFTTGSDVADPADQYVSSYGGSGRTFDNPGEATLTAGNVAGLTAAWNANGVAVNSQASPVIDGGTAYVAGRVPGQSASVLVADNAVTGATEWSTSLPGCIMTDNGLAVDNGVAYVNCDTPGAITAVDLATHTQRWFTEVDEVQTYNYSAADGYLFTMTSGGVIDALAATDGHIAFQITVDHDGQGPVAFAAADGHLVIAEDHLTVYDDATGALEWTGNGDYMRGNLTLDDDRIMVTDFYDGVSEWPLTGCGALICQATWNTSLRTSDDPAGLQCLMQPGGADTHTVAVTIRCGNSRIALVDESTGAITNTIVLSSHSAASSHTVRSGNLLWLPVYSGDQPYPNGVEAFDATCTSNCQPLVDLTGVGAGGSPEPTIAVGDGTVLIQTWDPGQVLAYRVPASG